MMNITREEMIEVFNAWNEDPSDVIPDDIPPDEYSERQTDYFIEIYTDLFSAS